MKNKSLLLQILTIFYIFLPFAFGDTPPPGTVKAKTWSGDGNTSIGATSGALNTYITNSAFPISGTVTANQGGTWSVGRTWTLLNTTDSVNSVQSGTWTTGRTWSLLNTTDSVNSVQSGTWTTGRTWNLSSGADSVAAAQSGSWSVGLNAGSNLVGSVKLTDGTNTAAVTAASAVKVDGSAVTQPVSGTVTANVGTTNGLALDATVAETHGSVSGGASALNSDLSGGVFNSVAPSLSSGQQAALQLDSSGNLKTVGTSTISGTVTANQGTSPWVVGQSSGANLHADIDNFPATQAVTQSGTWTTGRTWSLLNSTDSVNAVQSGTWTTGRTWSLLNTTDSVNAVQSGSWSVTANIGTTNGLALDATVSNVQGSASGGTAASKSDLSGGIYNSSAPSLTTGQQASLQLNSSGGLKVDGSAVTQPISAVSLPLPTNAATAANQTTGNSTLSTISGQLPAALGTQTIANSMAVNIASNQTVPIKAPVNANGTLSSRQTVTSSESTLSAPSNTVAVIIECESVNADNLRWGFSSSASAILSSTLGMLCEPGRDSGIMPFGAGTVLHMISTGAGSDFMDVQWVQSQ